MNPGKNIDQIHDLKSMTVLQSKPTTTGHESNLPSTQTSESSTEAQKKKRTGKRRRLPSW